MAIDDYLRVAWSAQRDGHGPLREAMLTLALAESGPDDAWAERCRARLLAERPGHFLGSAPTLAAALADPRVDRAIARLRALYPPGRVGRLRFRAEFIEGPYTGEATPLAMIRDALIGPPAQAEVRRDAPESARGPRAKGRLGVAALASSMASHWAFDPEPSDDFIAVGPDEETKANPDPFYLAVLLAIAMLLASADPARSREAA